MRWTELELRGAAADDNGLVTTVTPSGGGVQSFTLLAASANLDPPRRIMITSAGDDSGRTFTIVGIDRYGNARTEELAGPNTTNVLSTWEYSSVSSITTDDDTAGAIIIGWNNVFYSQWFPLDDYRTPFNVGFGVIPLGTVNYTVQSTMQPDLRRLGALGHNDPTLMVSDHASVSNETTQQNGNYSFPVAAIRLKLNSVDDGDGALIRFKQAWY